MIVLSFWHSPSFELFGLTKNIIGLEHQLYSKFSFWSQKGTCTYRNDSARFLHVEIQMEFWLVFVHAKHLVNILCKISFLTLSIPHYCAISSTYASNGFKWNNTKCHLIYCAIWTKPTVLYYPHILYILVLEKLQSSHILSFTGRYICFLTGGQYFNLSGMCYKVATE